MPLDKTIADRAPDKATAALFERIDSIETEQRFFRALDDKHLSCFAKGDRTLVVTFEDTHQILGGGSPASAMPLGHTLHDTFGWSFLTVLATERTWFRGEAVYTLFDELVDKGLFDAFDRVVFFGIGAAGYAACAYSVVAPGATVIAFRPQATLDPRFAAFDDRFREARRGDFSSRYGYAPRMVEGAGAVHLFYDPMVTADAAHAAQFHQAHVHHHPLRFFGAQCEILLRREEWAEELFGLVDRDELTDLEIAKLARARRDNRTYLFQLLDQTSDRPYLAALVCHNVTKRMNAPRIRRRLKKLREQLASEGITLPFDEPAAGAEAPAEAPAEAETEADLKTAENG